jgi:hypothetical protein
VNFRVHLKNILEIKKSYILTALSWVWFGQRSSFDCGRVCSGPDTDVEQVFVDEYRLLTKGLSWGKNSEVTMELGGANGKMYGACLGS